MSHLALAFVPHGHCYLWNRGLVGLHVGADGMIALAYYSIPLILIYFVRKRPDLPYPWIFLLFSAFIISCGTTHLVEIWTLWHADYWFSGIIKAITAIVSIYTAIALIPLLPHVIALPSIQELEQEIQRRKETESALRAYQARLAGILEFAEEAIISIDENQRITLFNQGAEKIFGWKADEILNQPLDRLLPSRYLNIHHQHIKEFSKAMDTARRMGKRKEIFGLRHDGSEFPAEASISKLTLEGKKIYTVFLRDISDRKQAETSLKQYERIVSATDDGIILLDRHYNYQIVNQAYLDWLGKTREAFIGHHVVEIMGETVFEEIIKPNLDRCLSGKTVHYGEWFTYPRLGRQFISVTYVPYHDSDHHISGVVISLRNITHLKHIEESLRENKLKFRQLIDNVQDVLYIHDAQTNEVLYLNAAFEEVWGIEREKVYENPCVWMKRIHPDDYQQVSREFESLESGVNFNQEYRIIRPDGEIRWIWGRNFPVFDESGKIYRTAGIAEDITERKIAQKTLELQDIIVKNMAEGICLVRATNGEIVYANPKFEQIFGYEFGELTGKHVSIVNYDDESKSAEDVNQEIRRNVLEKGEYSYEVQNIKKDGTPFWCRATTSCFDHPDYGKILVAVQEDISDRKATQEALRASEQRLQYLIKSSPAVIFSSKMEGDFGTTYISENVVEVLGYEAQTFLNDSRFWIDRVHPDDVERILANIPKIYERDSLIHEFRFLKADGSYCWLFEQIRLMRDEQNRPKEILGYLVDISDRKVTENLIATSLQEKEVLLKEIHHRVKNNLQVICSLLNLQSRSLPDLTTRDLIQESQNRVRSMAIVHEKLYCAKNIASINLAEYINDLTKNLLSSYQVRTSKVILNAEIDPTIFLDIDTAVPCGLILNELISNACKYAFSIEQQGEIYLRAIANEKQQLVLTVGDNGKGLPPDFDIDRTKTLGLQLVKSLTHQLRGNIIIERSQGTQFQVTLSRITKS